MPGFLATLASSYADAVKGHSGLHYVPSFNDLNSGANDDLEEDLLASAGRRGNDTSKGAPLQQQVPRRMSNKEDDAWPAFDTHADIHKVNRHTLIDGRKQWLYDMPKTGSGRPLSVMEEILRSEQAKKGGASGGAGGSSA